MINELALSIAAVALAVFVFRRTGSAIGATAFFLCAEFGPAFASPLLVSRIDTHPTRWALASLYVSQAVIFALLAWIVGHFALLGVLVLSLLYGSIALATRVLVRAAWTATTAPVGLIREANAAMNAGLTVWLMLGPAVGGAITAAGGARAALLVNVGLFAFAAVSAATARSLQGSVGNRAPIAGRIRQALRYVRTETLIRRLLSLQAVAWLFFSLSVPVEVVLAQRTLHAGAGGYGGLLAAWGAGAVGGSGLYARWRRRSSRFLMTLGTCFLGAGFLIMAIAPDLSIAIAGAAVAGVGNGSQLVAMKTALQEAVQEQWMSLVLSLNESMLQAIPGAGIVLGGALAAVWGPRVALAAAATGSFAVAILMWWRLAQPLAPALGSPPRPDDLEAQEELSAVGRNR